MRWSIILILFMLTLSPISIHAQADDSIIYGTVISETLNIRYAPHTSFTPNDTLIEVLHEGDVLTLHFYEDLYSRDRIWVYGTHEPTQLTGWVDSKNLEISTLDWQRHLPKIDSWSDLASQVVSEITFPYATIFWAGSGGSPRYLRAIPAEVPTTTLVYPDDPLLIYGTARINNEFSDYIYVQHISTGQYGWVRARYIAFPVRSFAWWANLPVVYEHDFYAEYANLPHAYLNVNSLNVHVTPSLDAEIVGVAINDSGYDLAVHGRLNHEQESWAYVTSLYNGVTGWVFDPNWDNTYLIYENGILRGSLPIISE